MTAKAGQAISGASASGAPGTSSAKFEGWAIVELFGHNRAVGYVTTEYFGPAALFRIDSPALPARDHVLKHPEYAHESKNTRLWAPTGSKVRREAVPATSQLIGPSSIYRITPCTEEAAMVAIENFIERPLILLELPKGTKRKELVAASDDIEEEPKA